MFAGILGIIETLLVLSLTFVVLATAASSVAGVFLRFTRCRARGYRNMIEYLYRNEVVPAVGEAVRSAQAKAVENNSPAPDLSAFDRFNDANNTEYTNARLQFIADIAMMPVPISGSSARDPRLDVVVKQGDDVGFGPGGMRW